MLLSWGNCMASVGPAWSFISLSEINVDLDQGVILYGLRSSLRKWRTLPSRKKASKAPCFPELERQMNDRAHVYASSGKLFVGIENDFSKTGDQVSLSCRHKTSPLYLNFACTIVAAECMAGEGCDHAANRSSSKTFCKATSFFLCILMKYEHTSVMNPPMTASARDAISFKRFESSRALRHVVDKAADSNAVAPVTMHRLHNIFSHQKSCPRNKEGEKTRNEGVFFFVPSVEYLSQGSPSLLIAVRRE